MVATDVTFHTLLRGYAANWVGNVFRRHGVAYQPAKLIAVGQFPTSATVRNDTASAPNRHIR